MFVSRCQAIQADSLTQAHMSLRFFTHVCAVYALCTTIFFVEETQPSTVVYKMEAQLEYMHIACTFLHIWRQRVGH